MSIFKDFGSVIVDENGRSIPKDEANANYQDFLRLQSKGLASVEVVAVEEVKADDNVQIFTEMAKQDVSLLDVIDAAIGCFDALGAKGAAIEQFKAVRDQIKAGIK